MMRAEQLFEKIAEVRPEVYQFFAATQDEVRESPFRDEIVGRLNELVKVAGLMGNIAGGVGTTIATGIAYNLAGDLYDSLRRGLTKGRNYRNMLAANPDLKREDGQKVRRAFEVLHQFNPEFSGNPVVAGSFVRDQAQLNELGNIQMLGNLVSARKNLSDIKKLPVHQIPLLDKESPVDKQYKDEQLKKLKQDIDQQGKLFKHQLKKLEQESDQTAFDLRLRELQQKTDEGMFGMRRDQLKMQTGPAARDLLATQVRKGRQDLQGDPLLDLKRQQLQQQVSHGPQQQWGTEMKNRLTELDLASRIAQGGGVGLTTRMRQVLGLPRPPRP